MSGVERIAAERQRQIDAEGWTPEHDDEHSLGEMVGAAICYLRESPGRYWQDWPWAAHWLKVSDDRTRNLAKAGALIAAEIDRLERAATPPPLDSGGRRDG